MSKKRYKFKFDNAVHAVNNHKSNQITTICKECYGIRRLMRIEQKKEIDMKKDRQVRQIDIFTSEMKDETG